jgi:hypothetical protein
MCNDLVVPWPHEGANNEIFERSCFRFLCALTFAAHPQDAGSELDTLNQETRNLYRAGKPDRATESVRRESGPSTETRRTTGYSGRRA